MEQSDFMVLVHDLLGEFLFAIQFRRDRRNLFLRECARKIAQAQLFLR
jgi:hypothetical protein